MDGADWTEGGGRPPAGGHPPAGGRARAASEALREAAGWQGELRERIDGLSWDRIAGDRRPGRRLRGSKAGGPSYRSGSRRR